MMFQAAQQWRFKETMFRAEIYSLECSAFRPFFYTLPTAVLTAESS